MNGDLMDLKLLLLEYFQNIYIYHINVLGKERWYPKDVPFGFKPRGVTIWLYVCDHLEMNEEL